MNWICIGPFWSIVKMHCSGLRLDQTKWEHLNWLCEWQRGRWRCQQLRQLQQLEAKFPPRSKLSSEADLLQWPTGNSPFCCAFWNQWNCVKSTKILFEIHNKSINGERIPKHHHKNISYWLYVYILASMGPVKIKEKFIKFSDLFCLLDFVETIEITGNERKK